MWDCDCRWCHCARRNVSCNWPWPSWRCSWTISSGWCSGWKTRWTARSSTRTDGSRSSRRSMRGASSSCCSSAEVFLKTERRWFERQSWFVQMEPLDGDIVQGGNIFVFSHLTKWNLQPGVKYLQVEHSFCFFLILS